MLLNYRSSAHRTRFFSISVSRHISSSDSHTLFSCFFFEDDSTTYSQVLTLYNPYDFAVRYKGTDSVVGDRRIFSLLVLCTAPRKYSIAEPQGEINAQHSVDTYGRNERLDVRFSILASLC